MKRPFFYSESSHYNGPPLLHRYEVRSLLNLSPMSLCPRDTKRLESDIEHSTVKIFLRKVILLLLSSKFNIQYLDSPDLLAIFLVNVLKMDSILLLFIYLLETVFILNFMTLKGIRYSVCLSGHSAWIIVSVYPDI